MGKGIMEAMPRDQQQAVGASMAEMNSPVANLGEMAASGIANGNVDFSGLQQTQNMMPAQQMTNVPPMPSNQMGTGKELFSQQAMQNAQGIYGGLDQRQNAVNAPMMFKDEKNNY